MTSITRLLAATCLVSLLGFTITVETRRQAVVSTPEAALGAAQHLEEVEGDLPAAVAAYRKVVDDRRAPRAVAATALLRMGRVHERLGNREARLAYERLAREYADLPAIVAEARRRLAALGAAGASADDGAVVARQVWAGRDVDPFGSVSTDGRAYVFVDWRSTEPGNLAVRDLSTGETRRLTDFRAAADGFAESPAWSFDGRRIAYVWSGTESRPAEIRTMASDGTAPRTIFSQLEAYPYELRWSPDGRRVAFFATTYGKDVTTQLVVLDAETGRVAVTKSQDSRSITLGGFSPDGKRLAYSVASAPSVGDSEIRALDIASAEESVLVSGPGRNVYPAWNPDGSALVFLSDRSGALGLWRVDVADGQPSGQPQLLKPNTGDLTGIQISRDGAVWYGVVNGASDVYLCDFDPASVAVTSEPTPLTDRFIGANSGAAWSPDGKHIAFMRGTNRRKRVVVVRSLESGTERELPAPFTDTIHAANWGPTWLPDSNALLVSDVNFGTSRFTIHQLGLQPGEVHVALDGDFRQAWPQVRVSPDGRAFYFVRRILEPSIERSRLVLVRRDRATGAETELYQANSLGAVGFFGLAVSPDGTHVAFSQNVANAERHLMLVPVNGGAARVLYRGTYSMPQPQTGVFTRDGRHVLVTGRGESSRSSGAETINKLWAIPVEGGAPRQVGLERRGGMSSVSLSPDGRRLVFTGGTRTGELWTIRNLLAPAQRSTGR